MLDGSQTCSPLAEQEVTTASSLDDSIDHDTRLRGTCRAPLFPPCIPTSLKP